ncbi:MAG: GMC family oxidoreductase N-terminal domain-containing protein [Hyphomicrobiaceae bacterium]
MQYDYIIVGGGSAGSVLANRLSAKSSNNVLLLEAGPDTPPGNEPKEILDSYSGTAYFDPRFHWTELKVRTEVVSHNNPDESPPPFRKYEQARVLGGGSSINGQLANRGAPTDYAIWEERGAKGWNWDQVLPYFRKVERDENFDGPYHGKDGHIPVRRIFPEHWSGFNKAAAKAFEDAGFPYIEDQNGEFKDGYFPITHSNSNEQRVSAAIGYLNRETRKRPNLRLSTETQVSDLLFEGNRCVGVKALVKGQPQEFRAREIILSCGAIHSPAHLLRAGIGPVGHLKDMGIEVRSGLAGVGQRLMDHPSIAVSAFVKRGNRMTPHTRRHLTLGMRYSSNLPDIPKGDMFVAVVTKSAWHAVGEKIGSQLVFVNRTCSERGEVKLTSRDWREEPLVEFNLLSDHRDLERLMTGFRMLGAMYGHPAFRSAISALRPSLLRSRRCKLGVVNTKNKIFTKVAAPLLEAPEAVRSYLVDNFVIEGFRFAECMTDDDALEAFVRKAAIGVWHASCTCRMGADGDPMAVTDNQGRLRGGIQGLRIVDASIFPIVPSANTNFPTLMTAEKIADAILAEA